jgi:predicted adenine nucleotide alpha hydrolase (AANH) superfamily ATPase
MTIVVAFIATTLTKENKKWQQQAYCYCPFSRQTKRKKKDDGNKLIVVALFIITTIEEKKMRRQ